MLTIREKFELATYQAVKMIPRALTGALIGGFVYAKFADLPPARAVKIHVIFSVIKCIFFSFIYQMTEDMKYRDYMRAGSYAVLNAFIIYEVRRRGVLGDKLMAIWIVGTVANFLFQASGLQTKRIASKT